MPGNDGRFTKIMQHVLIVLNAHINAFFPHCILHVIIFYHIGMILNSKKKSDNSRDNGSEVWNRAPSSSCTSLRLETLMVNYDTYLKKESVTAAIKPQPEVTSPLYKVEEENWIFSDWDVTLFACSWFEVLIENYMLSNTYSKTAESLLRNGLILDGTSTRD